MAREIHVSPADPQWADRFYEEASSIEQALSPLSVTLHHIGSTAVPALVAKPVIDLLLVVPSLDELDRQASALADLEYRAHGAHGIAGRRFFSKGGDQRSHHLHAFQRGDAEIVKHLAFVAYLRAFPEVAQQYAALKMSLAKVFIYDPDGYCRGKHDFVQTHSTQAVAWAESEGLSLKCT